MWHTFMKHFEFRRRSNGVKRIAAAAGAAAAAAAGATLHCSH